MSESFYTSVERYGKNILLRGYENGGQVNRRIKFEPTLYIPTNQETPYKTLYGVPVEPVQPGDMKECTKFVKQYDNVSNFDVYGMTDYVAQFISELYSDAEADKDMMNIVTFDIEVHSNDGFPSPERAVHPITSISAHSSREGYYRVWTLAEWDPEESELDLEIEYYKCETEEELITEFLEWWCKRYPDIITGWNIEHFDVPYLHNRILNLFGEDKVSSLSPWGVIHQKEVYISGKQSIVYDIKGIQELDYIKVFIKFGYNYPPQESYKLDHIGHVVLGEKKINYEEYGSLFNLFEENPQKFVDYSIKDTMIVVKIDEKEDLINLIIQLAYKGGVNFQDTFGSVKIWDTYIYNELMKDNIIVPKNIQHHKVSSIEGGHVKHPYKGMHHYVASFDLNSLYPHIIMQYNMSPETVSGVVNGVDLEDLLAGKVYDFDREKECMCATGQLFRKDIKGVLPRIVEELYEERKVYKGKMKEDSKYGNMQMAVKILMNSLYGAMSNQYFRYYDDRIAEGITVSGQLASRWAEGAVNRYLNKTLGTNDYDYVIAIDTDSLYLRLEKLVDSAFTKNKDASVHKKIDFLDKVCERSIGPQIEEAYKEMQKLMAAPVQKMEMKREILADKGIWTKKKRYVLNVYDNEGDRYETPKQKVVGLESKRSDIPEECRKMIEETFKVILNGGESETQKFILENRKRFYEFNVEAIAFTKTASEIKKYSDKTSIYRKGTPIHVRGALLYNKYLQKKGLDNRFELIGDGEKVKYTYLRVPNPIRENVIAFPDFLPKELELREFVDYDMQFEKAYVTPIQAILDVLNWNKEEIGTLEDFWG